MLNLELGKTFLLGTRRCEIHQKQLQLQDIQDSILSVDETIISTVFEYSCVSHLLSNNFRTIVTSRE